MIGYVGSLRIVFIGLNLSKLDFFFVNLLNGYVFCCGGLYV